MSVQRDKTVDVLLQAREAYERRDWVLALDRLRGAGDLAPEDTMALATSAYLLGNVDEAVRALQGGYQDRIRNGDSLGAVRFASWLGLLLNVRGEIGGRRRLGRPSAAAARVRNRRRRRTWVPARPRVLPAPRPRGLCQGRRDSRPGGPDRSPVQRTRLDRSRADDAGQDHDLFRSSAGRTCLAR